MFRKFIGKSLSLSVRAASTAGPKEKWDLCVGVLVERLPILSKKLNAIEEEMKTTLSHIEFENSLKSDHELRKEKDKINHELVKAGKMEVDLDDARVLQTAQDIQDLNQEELARFTFAPTTSENENNLKSLERKLDDTLMLLCSQKIDKQDILALPQAKWNEGESLRQTAERIVKENLGEGIKVSFYGNAPCGFYKYKYKTADKSSAVGAKTFFYRASYKTGQVNEKSSKFEWVNEEEFKGKVRPSYYHSVSQFLVS